MHIQVLGPLRVTTQDGPIALNGSHARGAIGWLASHANHRVGYDSMAHALWDRPPPDAERRLNLLLRTLTRQFPAGTLVVDSTARLVVHDGAVDAERFEHLVDDAYRYWFAGEFDRAAANVEQALSVWRGNPYPDLAHTTPGTAEISRLEVIHADALELQQEAILSGPVDFTTVADLRYLVGTHPDRIGFRRQLSCALYRTGRQVEAIEVLRTAVTEIGDDPSIRELSMAILRQDVNAVHRIQLPNRHFT